jgi:HipA-like protein
MKAAVYYNNIKAGTLERLSGGYRFEYMHEYALAAHLPSVSLTLPKRLEPFESIVLFSFFFGLLAEGANKTTQCRELKIDENDHFTRLVKTLDKDSIGAITIKAIEL